VKHRKYWAKKFKIGDPWSALRGRYLATFQYAFTAAGLLAPLVVALFSFNLLAFFAAYFMWGFPERLSTEDLAPVGCISILSGMIYMSWMAIYYANMMSRSSEIERETEGSKFVQTLRLPAGDAGNRIEFANTIDWKTKEANLKATFPLSAGNNMATYNWDIGTIQRPNEGERQFEVASHQWIDLTDQGGGYGATVLTDCKNASDKPNDNTVRLTLIRTPGTRGGYADQGTQDLGHHDIVFGLAGHSGDWREGQTDWQAYRLNDPLVAFEALKHPGSLGKQFSLVHLSNPRIRVLALKKAEQSDEVVLRLVEMDGKAAEGVHVAFASPVVAAREINGQEQPQGAATVQGGQLVTSFTPNQPRSFALRLGPAPRKVAAPRRLGPRTVWVLCRQRELQFLDHRAPPPAAPGRHDSSAAAG